MYIYCDETLGVVICFVVEQKSGVQVFRYCWLPTSRVKNVFLCPKLSSIWVGHLLFDITLALNRTNSSGLGAFMLTTLPFVILN